MRGADNCPVDRDPGARVRADCIFDYRKNWMTIEAIAMLAGGFELLVIGLMSNLCQRRPSRFPPGMLSSWISLTLRK
jgi:hypothetical protein